MKVVNNFITLILLTAILSVITNVHVTASTDDGPEEEAEEAAEEDRTEVYDDNPDLDKDGTVTEGEYQQFQDAAVALADELNSQEEEQEQNDQQDLPLCDGSFQDCITEEGFFCEAGSTEHTCEIFDPELDLPSNSRFDPDEDCLFNVDQPKCTPPEGVDCPEGFGTNEDRQCFPLNEDGDWECPEDHHSVEDDETGQCYPDEEGCPEGMIWTGKTEDSHNACSSPYSVCDEMPEHDVCIEYCNEGPNRAGCPDSDSNDSDSSDDSSSGSISYDPTTGEYIEPNTGCPPNFHMTPTTSCVPNDINPRDVPFYCSYDPESNNPNLGCPTF
jgi:hypothetical protein